MAILQQIDCRITYDPIIIPLGEYLKEVKAGSGTNICTPKFIATLFAIATGGNSPSVHGWVNGQTITQWNLIQP